MLQCLTNTQCRKHKVFWIWPQILTKYLYYLIWQQLLSWMRWLDAAHWMKHTSYIMIRSCDSDIADRCLSCLWVCESPLMSGAQHWASVNWTITSAAHPSVVQELCCEVCACSCFTLFIQKCFIRTQFLIRRVLFLTLTCVCVCLWCFWRELCNLIIYSKQALWNMTENHYTCCKVLANSQQTMNNLWCVIWKMDMNVRHGLSVTWEEVRMTLCLDVWCWWRCLCGWGRMSLLVHTVTAEPLDAGRRHGDCYTDDRKSPPRQRMIRELGYLRRNWRHSVIHTNTQYSHWFIWQPVGKLLFKSERILHNSLNELSWWQTQEILNIKQGN